MLNELKNQVYNANLELFKRGIVIYTWGNVSCVDRKQGFMIIKPSGVNYNDMRPEDMVVVDLKTGEKIEGNYNPSSDAQTHLELYRTFTTIGGITHTHSINAVAFAQAGMDIPVLGTTQADYFYGSIPCTRELTKEEIEEDYELNTGKVIVECFKERKIDPMSVPGIVVKNHGPFSWGKDVDSSVYHAVVMDVIAEMNLKTLLLNPKASASQCLIDKHYLRKHGSDAYYGQNVE